MSDQTLKRKLTAILYADVAGYSRLTGQDELGTHQRVMEVLDYASESIQRKDGSVLRCSGDAILAEFPSVVGAAAAAVAIQNELAKRNAEEPDDNKIQIRIGLNLGEVLEDRGEIYGDGVNLAARLEEAAEPGGVCLSSAVHEQIKGKIDVEVRDCGSKTFKNIAEPVHIYCWRPGVGAAKQQPGSRKSIRPSVAVLPFDNMSADPEQEYFADGMAEDIIAALSQLSALSIVARNSSFAYKGRSVKVQDIASDLDVCYVLEGSVRKSGNRARITAQLIDALDGHHLWAERYDRELDDIFEVQDEITRNVAIALQVKLSAGEHARIWQSGTRNFEAWQSQIRGVQGFYRFTPEGRREARECFEKAVSIDPDYIPAWAALGHTLFQAARFGDSPDSGPLLERIEQISEKLLAQELGKASGYALQANLLSLDGQHELAIAAAREAVEVAPDSPDHRGRLAHILVYSGEPAEALKQHNVAIRLSPHHPNWFTVVPVLAHYMLGDLESARSEGERAVEDFPDYPLAYVNLAGICAVLGLDTRAREMVDGLLCLQPTFSLADYAMSQLFANPEDADTWIGYLSKAGFPD